MGCSSVHPFYAQSRDQSKEHELKEKDEQPEARIEWCWRKHREEQANKQALGHLPHRDTEGDSFV
jgi:hypothetical protein